MDFLGKDLRREASRLIKLEAAEPLEWGGIL